MLVLDKDNIKDEKVNLVNSNAIVKAQFNNPLLLKKRKGGKLFETDRSERKYSCDVELTNDITRKQEKLENQSVISGKLALTKTPARRSSRLLKKMMTAPLKATPRK